MKNYRAAERDALPLSVFCIHCKVNRVHRKIGYLMSDLLYIAILLS